MSSDYSTHDSTASVADNEWVRGDLPAAEAAPAPEPTPEPAFELQMEQAPPEAMPLPPVAEAAPVTEPVEAAPPEAPVTVGQPAVPLSLEALVESLLFVADGAVPVGRLAEALEVKPAQIEAVLDALTVYYAERGLSLQRIKDKVQLTTAPAAAAPVQRFLGLSASAPLSKAALETLAIIAYQQPITRPQIEAIRGVNSDSVIKNLLTKGLVEESGRTEGPGRPTLYATTPEFLQHFGLVSLEELPPLNVDDLRREGPLEILKG